MGRLECAFSTKRRVGTHNLAVMSDSSFLRPGSEPEPAVEAWPYVAPRSDTGSSGPTLTPEPLPLHDESETEVPHPQMRSQWRAVLVAAVAGMLLGGAGAVWASSQYFADPESIDITLDVFPEYLIDLQRNDVADRSANNTIAVAEFEADFEAQQQGYVFTHGGEGASVDYGKFRLTIVNGYQSLPLPSNVSGTPGDASPQLVSLDSETVSCVFRPEVGLYESAVLKAPADLSAMGWSDCVMNDEERRISLRATSMVPGGSAETATRFTQALERTHAAMIR